MCLNVFVVKPSYSTELLGLFVMDSGCCHGLFFKATSSTNLLRTNIGVLLLNKCHCSEKCFFFTFIVFVSLLIAVCIQEQTNTRKKKREDKQDNNINEQEENNYI